MYARNFPAAPVVLLVLLVVLVLLPLLLLGVFPPRQATAIIAANVTNISNSSVITTLSLRKLLPK